MLGKDVLVAPVYEEGAREREVYLPRDGNKLKWRHYWSRDFFEPGQHITVPAPLEECPIFIREGAQNITDFI